jgi:acyl-coenzyme A thioesterase PaaI-like protein
MSKTMTTTSDIVPALQAALAAAAAEAGGTEPVSLTVDYGEGAVGEGLQVEAAVERATRTLVFVQARAVRPQGSAAATASAVFRVPATA